MGPIAVASHLAPFLPGHPLAELPRENAGSAIGPVSAAPYGSPAILTIPWAYIRLMGSKGLTDATRLAILNANYMAKRLESTTPCFKGEKKVGAAHEFILSCRPLKKKIASIEVETSGQLEAPHGLRFFAGPTIAHSPSAGTLAVEPTRAKVKEELDRFWTRSSRSAEEIRAIETSKAGPEGQQ
jgi:glycine dehydrogenase